MSYTTCRHYSSSLNVYSKSLNRPKSFQMDLHDFLIGFTHSLQLLFSVFFLPIDLTWLIQKSHPKEMVVAHCPTDFTSRNCFISVFSIPWSSDVVMHLNKEFYKPKAHQLYANKLILGVLSDCHSIKIL